IISCFKRVQHFITHHKNCHKQVFTIGYTGDNKLHIQYKNMYEKLKILHEQNESKYRVDNFKENI
ncbi:hypothetical protein BpHYR1_047190, partial [Brachionus plicatilis]